MYDVVACGDSAVSGKDYDAIGDEASCEDSGSSVAVDDADAGWKYSS